MTHTLSLSSPVLSKLGFGVRNLSLAVAVEGSVCQPCPPDLWLIVFSCAEFGLKSCSQSMHHSVLTEGFVVVNFDCHNDEMCSFASSQ